MDPPRPPKSTMSDPMVHDVFQDRAFEGFFATHVAASPLATSPDLGRNRFKIFVSASLTRPPSMARNQTSGPGCLPDACLNHNARRAARSKIRKNIALRKSFDQITHMKSIRGCESTKSSQTTEAMHTISSHISSVMLGGPRQPFALTGPRSYQLWWRERPAGTKRY